jgi:hypothetical protein
VKWHVGCALLLAWCGACGGANESPRGSDVIPGIPKTQQRVVHRFQFGRRWPFRVESGTLACVADAVVFRVGGVSYAMNDAALSRGFAAIAPIRPQPRPERPSNPMTRLVRDQRMRIFTQAMACERGAEGDRRVDVARCTQRLRESHGLTQGELNQIDVEGHELFWPPLSPSVGPLGPLTEAALKLCPR